MKVLRWAIANGFPWSSCCSKAAGKGGHLDILKWEYENGLLLRTHRKWLHYAAKGGHLELLKWAITNGFKLDDRPINLQSCWGRALGSREMGLG